MPPLTYANGVTTRMTLFGVPFALSYDFNPNLQPLADSTTIATQFAQRLTAYSNTLAGAGVFRRLTVYPTKYPISGTLADSSGEACVTIAGTNVTNIFTPGTRVHVGGRIAPRKSAHWTHDGVSGNHVVLTSSYDTSANTTTICLSCSRYAFQQGGCMSSQGWIALNQKVQQGILPTSQGQALVVPSYRGIPRRGTH